MRLLLFVVTLFCIISSLMARTDDPVRDIINSTSTEPVIASEASDSIKRIIDSSSTDLPPITEIPADIRALIEDAEAREALETRADERPRFCKNSRGLFYHPEECRRKKLEASYCQYGGCGKDSCYEPSTSCAQKYAKANGINTNIAGTTTLDVMPETETDEEKPDAKNYVEIPGACGSNIFIANPINGFSANSAFGYRKDPFTKRSTFHSGSDFKAPSGTPIRASAPGVMKCPIGSGYGRGIEIDHGQGLTTRYAHMTRYRNSAGKKSTSTKSCNGRRVNRGDIIGYVGSTGRSTGPHLHYEIRCNKKAIDPRKYIGKVTLIPIPQKRPDFPETVPVEQEDEPMDSSEVEE